MVFQSYIELTPLYLNMVVTTELAQVWDIMFGLGMFTLYFNFNISPCVSLPHKEIDELLNKYLEIIVNDVSTFFSLSRVYLPSLSK